MLLNLLLYFSNKVAEISILNVTLNDNTPRNVLAIDGIRSVPKANVGDLF